MIDRRGKSWVNAALEKYAGAERRRLPEGIRGMRADIAVVDEFTTPTFRAKTRPQLYDNIPKPVSTSVSDGHLRYRALEVDRFMTQENKEYLYRLAEGWRPICPKRARKLRRRGEFVWYIKEFGSNAWIPPHLRNEEH